jgi:AcrR family transcriptional regulator
MLAEHGYENFNIRELARRAGVAQRTLYIAFASREGIVINAILHYASSFSTDFTFIYSKDTLRGRLERTIKAYSFTLDIRPYATALMAIHNTSSVNPHIRRAIRGISSEGLEGFAEELATKGQLEDNVTSQRFADQATTLSYGTLSSWCAGEIPDTELIEHIVEVQLMVIVTSTRGAVAREAAKWLRVVRNRGEEWRSFLAETRAPDRPTGLRQSESGGGAVQTDGHPPEVQLGHASVP